MTCKQPPSRPTPRDQVEKRLRHQFGLDGHIARIIFDLHFHRPD